MRKLFVLMAALVLLAGASLAAPGTAPKAKVATHDAQGTIVSASDTQLVISHKIKGKMEESKFVLNATTRKEGDMTAGSHVTVHYVVENNQNVATVVKAEPVKVAAKKKS